MTVVYVDMVADLFHAGHVALLRRARQMGDEVVVGVLDDETAASYKRNPIIHHANRIAVVAACRYVDRVIPHAPLRITEAFLAEHDIDLVVHAHPPEQHHQYEFTYQVPIALGKFRRLDYTPGISTTAIIARCANAQSTA